MSDQTKTPDTENKPNETDAGQSVVEKISEDVLNELAGGMPVAKSGHSEASWSRTTS